MNDTPRGTKSDEVLVREAKLDRDGPRGKAAASELLGRYREAAYLWCLRHVRDHDRALDLAQDALINAYRALPAFDQRSKFSSWLYSIVRNRCLTALRPKSLTRDDEVDPDDLHDAGANPESLLERQQEEGAVLELIQRTLEPHEQEAIWMRCVDRLPVDEITRLLGIRGASGARSVLQNARRKLRAAIERGDVNIGGET